jgi:hypothetical protein
MKKLIFYFDGTRNDPADGDDFFEDAGVGIIVKSHVFWWHFVSPQWRKCVNTRATQFLL